MPFTLMLAAPQDSHSAPGKGKRSTSRSRLSSDTVTRVDCLARGMKLSYCDPVACVGLSRIEGSSKIGEQKPKAIRSELVQLRRQLWSAHFTAGKVSHMHINIKNIQNSAPKRLTPQVITGYIWSCLRESFSPEVSCMM